jgi:hypothetical protein
VGGAIDIEGGFIFMKEKGRAGIVEWRIEGRRGVTPKK